MKSRYIWKILMLSRTFYVFKHPIGRNISNMKRMNCWEYMKCGREPGGEKVETLGVCPAAIEKRVDGINNGINAGRACWAVPNTNCFSIIDSKFDQCLHCDFFQLVEKEEGRNFVVMGGIIKLLK